MIAQRSGGLWRALRNVAASATILTATLTTTAPAVAQPGQCHADIAERTRRTATIEVVNDGYGARCVTHIGHRCGRYLSVHRRIVTTRAHRLTATIDCGTLRLHHLEVTVR